MPVRVSVLGLVGGQTAGSPGEVRPPMQRALLAYLALVHPHLAPVGTLTERLWFAPPGTAANTIQQYVSALRRVLGPQAVVTAPGGYGLDADAAVDLAEFRMLATRAEDHARLGELSAARRLSSEALSTWSADEPLQGLPECPFVEPARAQLVRERDRVRLRQYAAMTVLGAAAEAVEGLQGMHLAEPLDESVAAELMRALAATGRQAEAFDVFETVRHTLAEELGVDPGPELLGAHQAVLTRRAVLPGDAVDAPGVSRTVPPETVELLGREQVLDSIGQLLARHTAPLVTLTGPGGVGKTSIAGELARRRERDRPVLFVPLAEIGAPASVLPAIAAELAQPDGSDDLPRQLGETLRRRDILLVLDNFEHVMGAAPAVGDLARHARGVVVTSRERLRLEGEHVVDVAPLAVDPSRRDGGPAVRLFVERAVAAGCDPATLERDRDAVLDICVRLDGLPLALELAAARASVMSPAAIAERLDHRLGLLTTGRRDAVARHRTLSACIDWSAERLGVETRRLLATLSLFPGGATLPALESVWGDTDDLLEHIADLAAKSLVTRRSTDSGDRFVLLQVISEYAAQVLDDEPGADTIREAFLDWGHGLIGERLDGTFWGARTAAEAAELHEEAPNLRLALELARRRGDLARWADLAVGLARIWLDVALVAEVRHLMAEVRTAEGQLLTERLVDVINLQAIVACITDRDDEFRAHATRARELLRQHPDPRRQTILEFLELDMAFRNHDRAAMQRHFAAARAHATDAADPELLAYVESWADVLDPPPPDLTTRLEAALRTARRVGNEQVEEAVLAALSDAASRATPPRWHEARSYAEAGEQIMRRFGAEPRRTNAILQQVEASISLGDRLPQAAELAREALVLIPYTTRARVHVTLYLGTIYLEMGHEAAALECYVAAERMEADLGRGLREVIEQSPVLGRLGELVCRADADELARLRARFVGLSPAQVEDAVVLAR